MTTMVSALALTLYVGAARADATPAQVEQLREQVPPAAETYTATGDEAPLRAVVRAVMGDGWKPTGDWADMVTRLGGEL